jgi:hypothetical protein
MTKKTGAKRSLEYPGPKKPKAIEKIREAFAL